MNIKKTNALRLLDQAEIKYDCFEYDINDGKIDAVSVALKIGQNADQVFKTLVTVSPAREYFVFIIPGNQELDLKLAAKAAKQKNIEMIPSRSLLPLTGYVHGGCSPLGIKKMFASFIDESAVLYDRICVSAGKVGLNVCLNPQELAQIIHADFALLTKEKI